MLLQHTSSVRRVTHGVIDSAMIHFSLRVHCVSLSHSLTHSHTLYVCTAKTGEVAVTVVVAEPCLDTSKPVPCTNCDFSDKQDLATIKTSNACGKGDCGYATFEKLAGGWEVLLA